MVELQEQQVRFAAVHARVRLQVRAQLNPVLFSIATYSRDLSSDVLSLVREVVLSPVGGMALTAMCLPLSSGLAPEREVIHGLSLVTHAAELRLAIWTRRVPSSVHRTYVLRSLTICQLSRRTEPGR